MKIPLTFSSPVVVLLNYAKFLEWVFYVRMYTLNEKLQVDAAPVAHTLVGYTED